MARKPATRPAKAHPATAANRDDTTPQNTEGAEDSLKGTQIPDKAEGPQQPTESKPVGTAGGTEPPATNVPGDVSAPGAQASLAAVLSETVGLPPPLVVYGPKSSEPELPPQGVLIVTGPKRGRWRAGRHFGPEPVSIPLEDLSEDELTAILGDPDLRTGLAAD